MAGHPPPGDGPPPPPRHAAPTGYAGQGDSVRPPHPHTRADGMWVADPNSPPRGRAVGGGGAPDHRRPSQRRTAPPPGTPFRHPHGAQRWPARARAMGPMLGPHARTDHTRDTRVAEPRLPAPEDGRPGEGRRLTPDAPHNGGRPPPPGTAPHHSRGRQPPQGMHSKGTPLGPHTDTPAPTACGWRTPTARPEGGQSGEGERLTKDAPHNGGRHPAPGTPFGHPHSDQHRPARAHAVGPVLGPPAGTDRTPDQPGRGTPAARPRGRAAGGGTAPDTRRPSQRWQATPPGDGPPPALRHAAPTGHAGQQDSVGPPHPHTRAHSTSVADPNGPPSGRAVGGGGAPGLRRPSQQWKAPPPGTPFRHPHSEQRRPTRAHAVGPVLGPHARTDRTRETWVAEPRPPAPEDGRPGEGQRLPPDAPHNGGRPSTPGTAPHNPRGTQPPQGMQAKGTSVWPPYPHTRAHSTGVADPKSPPSGRAVRGGGAPGLRRPSQRRRAPPPGDAPPPPPQRATPARKGARCGAGAGSPRPQRPHPRQTGRGDPAARPRGRAAGGGTAPDTRSPSERWQASPPGDGPPPPPRDAAPTGHPGQGDSVGPPHPDTRANSTWVADPNSPPSGRAVRGGGAPDHRCHSQRLKAPPRERPSATPTAGNAGPQGRTLCGRCWVPTPAPTAPGTHGSRNPGCPLQRTGGRGRDSA